MVIFSAIICYHIILLLFQVAENLAQLMYSVLMTGYMFRNAQYRLELQQSLEQAALPDVQDEKVFHMKSCTGVKYEMDIL